MKTVSNSTPIRSRDARSAVQQSLLHTLPEEILSRILHMVMAERWQFDFEATRADVLLVCKAFHRLGRGVLYEDVLLSSTVSFHTFFCVDMVDWEAVNGLTNVEPSEKPSTRWKDFANDVLERREEDWSRVKNLTLDLNFTPAIALEYDYAPRYLTASVPFLWNSFGRYLTLQDATGTKLLPNLSSITERTTSDVEDYDTYRQQTHFRFSFFGHFSPSTFEIPIFPSLSLRLLHAPAMRYPTPLLQHTERLIVKDFVDLEDFFPFVQLQPPHLRMQTGSLEEHVATAHVHSVPHMGTSVRTLVCCNEDFIYHLRDEEIYGYLHLSMTSALRQFPNLRRLHLPRVDAFYQTPEGRSKETEKAYVEAIKQILGSAQDETLRLLEVVLDQTVTL